MDEHLCRGKLPNSGEWIVGYYLHKDKTPLDQETHYIAVDTGFGFAWNIVDCNTVGRCTGLADKNGMKIFEGDIVRISLPITGASPIVRVSEAYFDKGCFCVNWGGNYRPHHRTRIDSFAPDTTFEVIGNIYDNQELLSEEE